MICRGPATTGVGSASAVVASIPTGAASAPDDGASAPVVLRPPPVIPNSARQPAAIFQAKKFFRASAQALPAQGSAEEGALNTAQPTVMHADLEGSDDSGDDSKDAVALAPISKNDRSTRLQKPPAAVKRRRTSKVPRTAAKKPKSNPVVRNLSAVVLTTDPPRRSRRGKGHYM